MKNTSNLIPFGDPRRNKEADLKANSKGGKNSAITRRQKKKDIEEWERILNTPLTDDEIKEIKCLADAQKTNMKIDYAMKIRIVQYILKTGDINAYIKLMTMLGLFDEEQEEITNEELQNNAFIKTLEESARAIWKDAGKEVL